MSCHSLRKRQTVKQSKLVSQARFASIAAKAPPWLWPITQCSFLPAGSSSFVKPSVFKYSDAYNLLRHAISPSEKAFVFPGPPPNPCEKTPLCPSESLRETFYINLSSLWKNASVPTRARQPDSDSQRQFFCTHRSYSSKRSYTG